MSKTLYILGNGFDMHHGLKTDYCSFGKFLARNNKTAYENLVRFAGLPELGADDDAARKLWSMMEHSLSLPYREELMDHVAPYADSGASDGYDGYYAAAREVSFFTDSMTTGISGWLRKFIRNVVYPDIPARQKLVLDPNGLFLSCNYTETLGRYYGIPDNRILFIHGRAAASDDAELVFGHGADLKGLVREAPRPPENASEEDLEQWRESMNDQFDFALDGAQDAIDDYYQSTRKNVEACISNFESSWPALAAVEDVFVLGHSLSKVDLPYFLHMLKHLPPTCRWTCTFHQPCEKQQFYRRLRKCGIPRQQINMIEMKSLTQMDTGNGFLC